MQVSAMHTSNALNNGGVNMPALGKVVTPEELAHITAFLQSRERPIRP
jgi:hypothetical protein